MTLAGVDDDQQKVVNYAASWQATNSNRQMINAFMQMEGGANIYLTNTFIINVLANLDEFLASNNITEMPPVVDLHVDGNRTIHWNVKYAASCQTSGNWTGGVNPHGGSLPISITAQSQDFTLTCTNGAKTTSNTVTVKVPNISFYPNRGSVLPGETATLYWNVNDADSCNASGFWNGPRTTSGSESGRIDNASTFTLTCSNQHETASRSVTITTDYGTTDPGVDECSPKQPVIPPWCGTTK